MLKIIYTSMIFAVFSLLAQPTMNQGNLPQIGTKAEFKFYDAENLEQGPAGANQTWDFSNIVESADQSGSTSPEFVSASGAWQSSEFPDATFAEESDTAYTFYKLENNQLIRLGTGFEEGAEILTDHQLQYQIPFTYGDSYTDDFEGTTYIQGFESDREGTIETEADAYGSITVGNKNYNNTLRIKTYIEMTDVVDMEYQGFPITATITTKLTSYSWLLEGQYYPVFSMTEGTITTEASGMAFDQDVKNAYGMVADDDGPTLTTPQPVSPEDGAKNITAPVTLEWTESEITQQGKSKLSSEDVKYIVKLQENGPIDVNEYIDTVSTNSITYDTLVADYFYVWEVKAFTDELESGWSEKSSFFAGDQDSPPSKPVLLTPENNSENVSTIPYFSWEDAGDASSWTILVDDNPQFAMPVVEKVSQQNFYELKTVLDTNKTYYWKVKALEGDLESEWSDVWTFKTTDIADVPDEPLPSAPANMATDVTVMPTFEWADDGAATKWNIVIADNSDLMEIFVDKEITENSYEVTVELDNETTFYWAVRGGNETGWGEFSDVWSFTTEPASSVIYDNEAFTVKVIPNPAHESLVIDLQKDIDIIEDADIIDINGQIISRLSVNDVLSGKINVSNLPAGKYFIRITGDKNYVIPFVKE